MIIYPIAIVFLVYIIIEQRQRNIRLRNTNRRLAKGLEIHEKIIRDEIAKQESQTIERAKTVAMGITEIHK